MLPTSNMIIKIGSIRADRFHYLPSVFFWVGLAMVVLALGAWLRAKEAEQSRLPTKPLGMVFATWVCALVFITHLRCHDWQSNLTIWKSALENASGSVKAEAAVANETVRVANTIESAEAALARIRNALEVYPALGVAEADWPVQLFSDYGAFSTTMYDKLSEIPGREKEAEHHLQQALAWMEKGMDYEGIMRQRWADRWAGGDLDKAPRLMLLHKNYAVAQMRAKKYPEALASVDRLLEKQPYKADYRELKAAILKKSGDTKAAIAELMLLSLMVADSTTYVRDLGAAIKELHPESNPLIRDGSGAWRLDLSDKTVTAMVRDACLAYRDILQAQDADVSIARFRRVALHSYGVKI
jgi:tetratricopeptide (TPR) repeat protein